jgi:hypothetical protein
MDAHHDFLFLLTAACLGACLGNLRNGTAARTAAAIAELEFYTALTD